MFVRTVSPDFSGWGAGGGIEAAAVANARVSQNAAPSSDLHIVDVASGEVTLLAKAMGFNTPADANSGTTYLPFGVQDLHRNYFPTVAPVAAGGYFWVFFDSLRNYGNLGVQRVLWGFAIDIQPDGSYEIDPSHPPFYVAGQEYGTSNHRAFAALDPCKKDGDPCTSGIDCCGGVCSIPGDAPSEFVEPVGICSPPRRDSCAQRDERCTSDADCCPLPPDQPADVCLGGFCAFVSLD